MVVGKPCAGVAYGGYCAVAVLALFPLIAAADAGGAGTVRAVRTVRVPDGGIHPQAQVDARGRVHLISFGGEPMRGDLFYVTSEDGGDSFSEPIRVNSQAGSVLVVGTIRGPQLALGKGGRVHVAWMGSDRAEPKAPGNAAPMLYARLNDAGDGFEPQRNLIRERPGLDGGGSVAADREGNVYVAWHAPAAGGKEHDEADRQVWVARSGDEGKTFSVEAAAIPKRTGVCGCCGMRIAALDGGRVFVAFRSATAQVHRDVHLLASDDHGKTFRIAAVDPWEVGTCVMSTAALAEAKGRLLAAWETREQVYLATLGEGDEKAGKPSPMPGAAAGGRKHPSIAVNDAGGYLVAWAEGTGWQRGGAVAWQVFGKDGRPVARGAGRADGLPAWGVPAAVALRDGTFVVIF